jgi:hypothetical protein
MQMTRSKQLLLSGTKLKGAMAVAKEAAAKSASASENKN